MRQSQLEYLLEISHMVKDRGLYMCYVDRTALKVRVRCRLVILYPFSNALRPISLIYLMYLSNCDKFNIGNADRGMNLLLENKDIVTI